MKHFWALALLAFGGYAIYKYGQTRKLVAAQAGGLPDEKAAYDNADYYDDVFAVDARGIAAPQRPNQLEAAYLSNPAAVAEFGYAPAFGPDENQGEGVEINL